MKFRSIDRDWFFVEKGHRVFVRYFVVQENEMQKNKAPKQRVQNVLMQRSRKNWRSIVLGAPGPLNGIRFPSDVEFLIKCWWLAKVQGKGLRWKRFTTSYEREHRSQPTHGCPSLWQAASSKVIVKSSRYFSDNLIENWILIEVDG